MSPPSPLFMCRKAEEPKALFFQADLILPDFFAVGVIGLADAVRLKYICAPIELILFLDGIPVGGPIHTDQLVLNPFYRGIHGNRDSANKEHHQEDIRAGLGFFPGSVTRS